MEANKRNTKIKIAKAFIDNNFNKDRAFTRNEISQILFVREKEFETFKEELFIESNKSFKIAPNFYNEISGWKEKHINSQRGVDAIILNYKKLFKSIENDYNYTSIFDKFKPLFNQLHWYFLPVYEDYMIENRGVSPENDINDYYDHFHSLQDLYKIIDTSPNYWKTLKGDINLNQECDFPIYTNRWGHEDIYRVKRIYDGWHVKNLGIEGKAPTNGETGGFTLNFQQDYVEYPHKFHYIIERLWVLADETEMSINELQNKLIEIANLISEVEKTVSRYTPDWYN